MSLNSNLRLKQCFDRERIRLKKEAPEYVANISLDSVARLKDIVEKDPDFNLDKIIDRAIFEYEQAHKWDRPKVKPSISHKREDW